MINSTEIGACFEIALKSVRLGNVCSSDGRDFEEGRLEIYLRKSGVQFEG